MRRRYGCELLQDIVARVLLISVITFVLFSSNAMAYQYYNYYRMDGGISSGHYNIQSDITYTYNGKTYYIMRAFNNAFYEWRTRSIANLVSGSFTGARTFFASPRGFAWNSTKEKRVCDILMALSKHRDAEWILRIIGDGEELDKLQATAENCGISERVFFHGWSENPWELVKTCTAFVLSSEYESFGLVLVEALARGIPVISSDCPHGPKEIVNERNGWRYPVGDVDRLSSIMGDIINMRVPLPSIDSCIRSAKRFAKEIILPRFEDAIRQFAEQSLNNQALAEEES